MTDEEQLTREVYAHFGLAYYMAECVYRALVNVFAFLPFKATEATRPRVEERTKAAESMTMGDLVGRTKQDVPEALHPTLEWALTQRNFLAHGYWFERIHLMGSAGGKHEMLDELTRITDSMRELNQVLDDLTFAHLRRLGMTDEQHEQAVRESGGCPVEPFPWRRIPRTGETVHVVRSWVVGDGTDRETLVVQDADGEMWQLCDAGLGWSYHTQPDEAWVPFDRLNRMLPAQIVARPKGAAAWSFKLHVSTGALITVDRHPTHGFTWSVRAMPGR